MKFETAIDAYIADLRGYGNINSPATERAYREKLERHAEDCAGRTVTGAGKADVKKTLRRWKHPNSKNQAHSVLTSFYDWTVEEDIRTSNPARTIRRARRQKPRINRLTREEVEQLLTWAASSEARVTERWVLYLGVCAGLRCQELCEANVRDVSRPGWVHVPRTAGKGAKERWVPVVRDQQPVIAEIHALGPQDGALLRPSVRASLPLDDQWVGADRHYSRGGMYRLIRGCGFKAGLVAPVTPHTLRHAFGDHIAKHSGLRVAQALLGHESVETTAGTYVDQVSLDELQAAVGGFSFFEQEPQGVSATNQAVPASEDN